MSTEYNYDDQGQFFPFFVLTISALVTLPLTYNLLQPSDELESTAPRIRTSFKPDHADLIQGQMKKQRRRERKLKRFVTMVLGYCLMAWMAYLIVVTQRTIPKIWDPYDILGVSRSASEGAIKKHFRKLTLQYHPDKVRIDETSNQTADDVTAHYVELSKAYKALTDEDIRNNYLLYGHPDGKQSFSIGIALPTFIVAEGYGQYTLALYGALLGVLLPYVVGRWWYGTQRLTKEGVLVTSAGNLFQQWREDQSRGGVVTALSHGDEFKQMLKGSKAETGLSKVEKAVLADDVALPKMNAKDRLALQKMEGPNRKALALLWAYLRRIELADPTLDDEKYEVAPQALALNDCFISMCLAFGNLVPLLNAYGASQNIISAVAPGASPLLQLPYVTPEIATKLQGESRAHLSIPTFMELPEAERRKRSLESGLSQSQYDEVVSVARQIPHLRPEKVFFKCMGEKHIVTGALVQLVLKCRVIPPGTTNIPALTDVDLEDVDPDEDDIDGLLGRKPPKKVRGKDGTLKTPSSVEKNASPPLAFAPYFARDHAPRWHVFLSDMRQGRVAVPPTTFATFTKPIFDASTGAPTFNVQTLKLQFQAPPQAGQYTFVMHLVCDSYLGMDAKQEVTLVVEDQAKAVEISEEEEPSEPEEDSIAGQMNALKTGGLSGVAAPPPRKKKVASSEKEAQESEDDESDTDGEADDTSDTDTDTSDEE